MVASLIIIFTEFLKMVKIANLHATIIESNYNNNVILYINIIVHLDV